MVEMNVSWMHGCYFVCISDVVFLLLRLPVHLSLLFLEERGKQVILQNNITIVM